MSKSAVQSNNSYSHCPIEKSLFRSPRNDAESELPQDYS